MEVVKDKIAVCTVRGIDAEISINTNGVRYRKVTLISASGKPARGVIYEKVWDKVSQGDEVNVALSLMEDNKTIIASVLGLPIESLSFDDYGVTAPAPVVNDDMENPFS
jgi:hypothetical protein